MEVLEQVRKMLQKMTVKPMCVLVAGAVLVSVAGCSKADTPAMVQTAAIQVQAKNPEIGSLTQSSEFIGTVEPNELVNVIPKMGGTAMMVYFGVGDTVKKGDVLFEVDPVDIQLSLSAQKAAVDVAQAAVMTAQAQVDQQLGSGFDLQMAQLQAQLEGAQNQYASARQGLRDYNDGKDEVMDDLAVKRDQLRAALPIKEADVKSKKEAWEQAKINGEPEAEITAKKAQYEIARDALAEMEGTISTLSANINDADDADAQARSLRTAVRNAQTAYESSNTIYELTKDKARSDALKVANASLGQAAASFEAQVKAYEAAAKQLEYTRTVSPIDGVIEACNVTTNAMVGQSSPAFVISNKSDIVATFYVSADAVRQMASGDKVTIESGRDTYNGTLIEVGSMADQQIGLFKVKASIENGDNLMTGVSVKIIAETAKANDALLIPQSAVHYEEGKGYVYVNKDGIAVRTPIETGVANNEVVEVLDGLTRDSMLITTWNPNLRDGVAVEIKAEAAQAQSSSAAASSEAPAASSDAPAASSEASAASSEASSSGVSDASTVSADAGASQEEKAE